MRATSNTSESEDSYPNLRDRQFAIVVAEWNQSITGALLEGAKKKLYEAGVQESNLIIRWVPGSFEIPYAARRLMEEEDPDAIIALGSLIRGETIHFDVIAHSVASAIQDLNLQEGAAPVLFGVLTDENMEQAQERAGGSKGNKGEEAAEAAIRLL